VFSLETLFNRTWRYRRNKQIEAGAHAVLREPQRASDRGAFDQVSVFHSGKYFDELGPVLRVILLVIWLMDREASSRLCCLCVESNVCGALNPYVLH